MDKATSIELIKKLKCIVIIPTYNNEQTIASVISDVRQYSEDILVVNDGSTDQTGSILEEINDIKLLSYQDNQGKGYALREGFKKALSLGYEYALTIDADGQHYADDIPKFIKEVNAEKGELLIGARNLNAERMPEKNSFANKFSNFWFYVETGNHLADTQSGFRLYPIKRLEGLKLFSGKYEFEVEIIVRASWRDIPVRNIPIKVYYPPAEERVSHFRPMQDFFRISVLNTILVSLAFIYYHPRNFLRKLTWQNIKQFFRRNLTHSPDSNLKIAISMGLGIFCGIIPLWGYQMLIALSLAQLFRLNKLITLTFSNISIPPCIPFILYGSYALGALVLGADLSLKLNDVSFETIKSYLIQYLIGSSLLALLAGVAVGFLAYMIMTLKGRKPYNG